MDRAPRQGRRTGHRVFLTGFGLARFSKAAWEERMALKLRVISDHYKQLGKLGSRMFGVTGGSIGRSRDNDWVLPDPERYISGHHARVVFNAGAWVLEDTSTNGVFVNESESPLLQQGQHVLKDGDRLRMGDYDILVSIDERADFPPDASGQLPAPAAAKALTPAPTADDEVEEGLDIHDLFTTDPIAAAPPVINNAYGMPLSEAVAVPRLAVGDDGHQQTLVRGKNHPEWHMATLPLQRHRPAAASVPRLQEVERSRAGDSPAEVHSGLEAFCRGAGIDPATFSTDMQLALLTLVGQMMRETVLGLMEALKGRSDLKGQFHLSQTTIQPSNNNPLKFSASVEEALRKLLDQHSSRYMGPVESLRDAFADLKTHQLAITASMQAAVDELLERLSPSELQERFDRGLKRGALLGATNKMKYWDLYTEFYQVLNQRDDQNLPSVFTDEFGKVYAERVAGFQGQRRK